MVWKINKHKRYDKQGIIKQKQVLESQPKLKSCLKTTTKDLVDHHNALNNSSKIRDDSTTSNKKSSINRLRSIKSVAALSRSSNNSNISVESKGSGNTPSVYTDRKRLVSVEQHSIGSRSWDRESRKSETAQSTQTSERSSTDSRCHFEDKTRRVHFSVIQIRDYERVVGDNPSCTIGPPVGIGWNYGQVRVIDINTFEASRSYKKSTSRLVLSREEREALLLNWGASFHDIIEAVRGNLKIKNQRRQTVTNLGKVERIEEAFETATRKLKSALMLRRSTGNKVKRLQEQANLAQSALTSLKIAEDRALSEIREASHVQIVENPKIQEDLANFSVSKYGPPPPVDNEGGRQHRIIPEDDDHATATGNSTTQSEAEIERFYRELELEMFGDEELPSMVGQTLEVPLKSRNEDNLRGGIGVKSDDASVNSGMTEKVGGNDLDAELLEKEENRSMISQYLLEELDNESPKFDSSLHNHREQDGIRRYFPSESSKVVHRDQISSRNAPVRKTGSPSEVPIQNRSIVNETTRAVEYYESHHRQQETIPLHAGMTMFDDCALLGGQNDTSSYRQRKRRSSRHRDLNAGPRVQFSPPPNHLTPSHWMDDLDSRMIPTRCHDTITIFEDDFNWDREPYVHKNHIVPPYYY